jgi:hypothetical protein
MITAFLKYWKVIVLAAAIVAAFIYHQVTVKQAYNDGVAYQQQLQAKADAIRSDLNLANKERIENDAKNKIAAAQAAASKSDTATRSLQQQLAKIKQLAERNTGAVSSGGTAWDAVVVLTDLLGRCSERYSRMAALTDATHAAGLSCEASYQSLRTNPPK